MSMDLSEQTHSPKPMGVGDVRDALARQLPDGCSAFVETIRSHTLLVRGHPWVSQTLFRVELVMSGVGTVGKGQATCIEKAFLGAVYELRKYLVEQAKKGGR